MLQFFSLTTCHRLSPTRYCAWDASRQFVATRPEMAPMSAWKPDRDVVKCTRCNSAFTMLLRRHHCRFCGDVFCTKCAPIQNHEGSTSVSAESMPGSGGTISRLRSKTTGKGSRKGSPLSAASSPDDVGASSSSSEREAVAALSTEPFRACSTCYNAACTWHSKWGPADKQGAVVVRGGNDVPAQCAMLLGTYDNF